MKKQILTLVMGAALLSGCAYLCEDATNPTCPNKKAQTTVARKADYTLDASLFAFDSAELSNKAKNSLDKFATALKDSGKKAEINGYTDSTGSADYNIDLSQRRAQAVASYLESKGVKAKNLTVKGYGATNFVATNDTAEGRAQNRRVDIVLK